MLALLNTPFKNYNIWWSLSDSKYAGTALLIKKCFQPKKISFTLKNPPIRSKDTIHENGRKSRIFWNEVVHCLFWSVWLERNRRIFSNVSEPCEHVWEKIKFRVDDLDCGQPGFILSEKKRFGSILREYGGKRMRIDYFVVSEKVSDIIVSCEMYGEGIELEGFYGSDIFPYLSQLSDPAATQLLPETSVS